MVRTQVQFREAQHERIRKYAHRSRISFAEAVRRLVDAGMGCAADEQKASGPQALLEIAGAGSSGLGDLGRRHDDYLAEDLGK